MPGFDIPWRLTGETESAIKRGLDYFERSGEAAWTKLQRGLVDAATTAVNAVAMSGATQSGISPAAAFTPLEPEAVGETVGAGAAFSPEARANEESLGLGASLATDIVAGVPTGFMGGAGAAADVAAAKGEAERSGMGPLGQAATTLLAAAPIVGPGTAARFVRELGGGTADEALESFKSVLDEASIKTPPADAPGAALLDFDEPPRPSTRPTERYYMGKTLPAPSSERREAYQWYEQHMSKAEPASGDADRFMRGLDNDDATP